MKVDLRKIYKFEEVARDAGTPLPTGGDVYYECKGCGEVVSSVPFIASACECGNLSGNKGEIKVRDAAQVKLVRGRLK